MPINEHQLHGHCDCGEIEYVLLNKPLFVHACHCLNCQRKSGSAFALTCFVVGSDISLEKGRTTPKALGPEVTQHGCPTCGAGIYVVLSTFPAAFLLPSSLDDPRGLTIGAHIWVKRKHAWLELPGGVPQFDEHYDQGQTWPKESLNRLSEDTQGAI